MRPVALALLCAVLATASAQSRGVEVGAEVTGLSGPYDDGRAVTAQLVLPRTGGWLRLSGAASERFGERALVYGVAGAQDLGSRWVAIGSAASSTAGIAHPRLQASLGAGRKWGARRQVLTIGTVALQDVRDGHRDVVATGEAVVYGRGLIVQGGARATLSTPGDKLGLGGHAAATVLGAGGRQVTLRLSAGREAYLVTGAQPLDVSFRSGEGSVTWLEPVGADWSVSAGVGLYANPYYTRVGVRTGLTRRF